MSREILFRGKRINNGEWVYGYLARFRNFANEVYTSIIQINDYETQECSIQDNTCVIPETVGQFTGLVDKNGKRVFDGDVVQAKQLDSNETVKVIIKIGKYTDFNSGDINIGVYALFNEGVTITINDIVEHQDFIEVIGNVYDDKELLGE